MTLAKTLPLAGIAALTALASAACASTLTGDEFAAEAPLVVSGSPLKSVSYVADYSQEGALPFTCEVQLRSDGMIRRNYTWDPASRHRRSS